MTKQVQAIEALKKGKIGILPTDTLYGIVGSALNPKTVEIIYKLRQRNSNKPFIILISSLNDLDLFDIKPSSKITKLLKSIWPNPVSIILDCPSPSFDYLHRGTKTLAFRLPNHPKLLTLLKATGPLVAPSANLEGQKPANNIRETLSYFGDKIDFSIDGGEINNPPSTLISLNPSGKIKVIRQGKLEIDKLPKLQKLAIFKKD